MRSLRAVAVLVLCMSFYRPLTRAQNPPGNSFFTLFNQEAAVPDPAGIQKYSRDLIELIVPEGAARESVIPSLSKRLARAEQRARERKGRLVSEAAIAHTFDDLMKEIGAPHTWRADVAQIRKFRERSVSAPTLSALFSASRNGTNCNPGEAVMLLSLLIDNEGQIAENSSDFQSRATGRQESSVLSGSISAANQHASGLLAVYCLKHNRRTIEMLFDHVARTLGF